MFFLLAVLINIDSLAQSPSMAADQESAFITPLRSRGFALMPSPQQVVLGEKNIVVDNSWSVVSEAGKQNSALMSLLRGAKELHNLEFSGKGQRKIVLKIQDGVVKGTNDPALNEQGYLLKIGPEKVEITGNADAGLFYGVQSLLQLLRRD